MAKQIDMMKRVDAVWVVRRPGAYAVWAGTIEQDNWLVAEVPSVRDADGLALRLSGWFRVPAMLSDRRFVRPATEGVS